MKKSVACHVLVKWCTELFMNEPVIFQCVPDIITAARHTSPVQSCHEVLCPSLSGVSTNNVISDINHCNKIVSGVIFVHMGPLLYSQSTRPTMK